MKVYLKEAGLKGKGLYATCDINAGDFVLEFIGDILPLKEASPLSLQIGDDIAIESTAQIDDFLNHSCDPNCKVVVDSTVYLVALKDIKKDDEVSFDYNTTEFDMVEQGCSFNCSCGSSNCQKEVKGFKHISDEQRQQIKNILIPYLFKLL